MTPFAPFHVAIIMDGNCRWARARRLSVTSGHQAGADRVRMIAEACADFGVRQLTLFAFSTENWRRPKSEVDFLIRLIKDTLKKDIDELDERDTQLRFIGDRTKFPAEVQLLMQNSELQTRNNKTLVLTIALNYGGRWDLTHAAKSLATAVERGEIKADEIDENSFANNLSTRGLTTPDLCIRTGGDRRLSNFLLWDLAYTELYFTDTYWPDFDESELALAFTDYRSRDRRYGTRQSIEATRALG